MAAPSLKRCNGLKRNRREHSEHPKHRADPDTIGKIHPRGTIFLRRSYGKASDPRTDRDYDLDGSTGGLPMITSGRTGKIWSISWDELIDLAVAAGIDREGD